MAVPGERALRPLIQPAKREVTLRKGWDTQSGWFARGLAHRPPRQSCTQKNSSERITNEFCKSFPRYLGRQERKHCIHEHIQDIWGAEDKKLFRSLYIYSFQKHPDRGGSVPPRHPARAFRFHFLSSRPTLNKRTCLNMIT